MVPLQATACPNCGAAAAAREAAPPPATEAGAAQPDSKGKKDKKDKKKDKVRSAWISFVGRIVAQVVGAVATITLGLIVAGRIGERRPSEPAASAPARPRDGRVSIAVLPLGNLSGDPQQEYFADGMTEALIADLARIRALRVISRTSVMQYKEARKPLPEIARELGVDVVLEGSVAPASACG